MMEVPMPANDLRETERFRVDLGPAYFFKTSGYVMGKFKNLPFPQEDPSPSKILDTLNLVPGRETIFGNAGYLINKLPSGKP